MIQMELRKKNSILEVIEEKESIILKTVLGMVRITPFSDRIFRITFTEQEKFSESSLECISALPQNENLSIRQEEEKLFVEAAELTLEIRKDTCAIRYLDKNGKELTCEPESGGKYLIPHEKQEKLYHTKLEFEWKDGEVLYGLGQSENGVFNLRGSRHYIYQANRKIAIPFFISTRGYGVLIDTGSPLIFNDNAYGSYLYNEAAEELSYYFIAGENFDRIIGGYRTLTGKASMLPLWAFGYIQSQERYETQQEILEVADRYRKERIPLDAIVMDWRSWEDCKWGEKKFDASRFPSPLEMTEELRKKKIHFMLSMWPSMEEGTENHTELEAEGCMLPGSDIYNPFLKKAREIYWKQAYEGLFSNGVDAWWCDSSEPFTPEWNGHVTPEPDKSYMKFCEMASGYLGEKNANAYAYFHTKGMYEGQRSVTDQKRVVNLTRSAYTGQQKFGTIMWSGDISASWKTLKEQIAAGLSFCASGFPYWTLDIGAFFVKKGEEWYWDGDYNDGLEDFGYRELYTRWMQFAAFLPVFRAHGTDTRREIWNYGKPGEMFYDAMVKAVKMRYRLLPYIYSMAAETYFDDGTILRLLAFDFPEDSNVYEISDQYMFGSALMICPVTEPMYYVAGSVKLEDVSKKRTVYLPKGCDWYDFRTNQRYAGGQVIMAEADIDSIPVFVKAGSVIPMAASADSTAQVSQKNFEVHVYEGQDGSFSLYQDAGDGYGYEKQEYSRIRMEWKENEKKLYVSEREGWYPGMPEQIEINEVRHQ